MGPRRSRQWTILVAVAASLATIWAALGAGPALAEGEAAALVGATNGSRQRLSGADPLARSADLDAVAQRHAAAMATRAELFHNPELGTQVADWRLLAENVGVGIDVAAIHRALLDSPSHRANVLDARLTQIGVGVVTGDDGRLWVVEVFRTPAAATGAAQPLVAAHASRTPAAAAPAPVDADAARRAAEARAAAEAEARAAARAEAQAAEAARTAAEAEAARIAAEVAAVAIGVDLASRPPYRATPILLSDPELVAAGDPATPARPAVVLAAGLWPLVALSLLRRVRSDLVHTSRAIQRLAPRTAPAAG